MKGAYNLRSFITLLAALVACEHTAARRAESVGTPSGHVNALQVGDVSVVRALVVKGTPLILDSTFTLDSVQRVLSKTALVAPHHHDDNWSICYSARDSIGPFTIRFQSNEMGGPDHDVLGIELIRESASTLEARSCAPLGVVDGVKTNNGLYLGMPIGALLKVMGRPAPPDPFPPVRSEGAQYYFRFHKQVTDSIGGQARTYNVDGWLAVRARHGRVEGLFAWHGTTM